MPTNTFTYNTKRSIQTGYLNVPTVSPSTKLYQRAVLSCTIGSMNKPSYFYSYPLMSTYFLHKLRESS